ncbi:MAG: hypothetical protein AB7S26_37040 [Sandaracinaceae bacterium]
MRSSMVAVALALWSVVGPSIAVAQGEGEAEVVVLAMGGDAPRDASGRAREAVLSALVAEGAHVLPDADVAMRIAPSRLASCRSASCAWTIATELSVPTAATVALWMDGDALGTVSLSLIVSADRTFSGSAAVADGDLAAAATRALAEARAAQRRSLLVEGPAAARPHDGEDGSSTDVTEPNPLGPTHLEPEQPGDSPFRAERSLEEWILPSLLGVVGLALVGLSVYALLDEQCDVRGASGDCLRGTAPNIGVGATFAVTGALAIAGGIIWLIVGGAPPNQERIDVVLGPDGGGAVWRGAF